MNKLSEITRKQTREKKTNVRIVISHELCVVKKTRNTCSMKLFNSSTCESKANPLLFYIVHGWHFFSLFKIKSYISETFGQWRHRHFDRMNLTGQMCDSMPEQTQPIPVWVRHHTLTTTIHSSFKPEKTNKQMKSFVKKAQRFNMHMQGCILPRYTLSV